MKSNADTPRRHRRALPALALFAAIYAMAWTPATHAEQPLAFAIPGVVDAVMVKPGEVVKKGAVLAKLDTKPFEYRDTAARAAIDAADRELEFAEQNLVRVKQLFDDLSTSKEELERATLRLANAKAGRAKAEAGRNMAGWRLSRATLRAPADGRVKSTPGYPGLVVDPAAGFTPVVVME
ncbi:MAG: biotin/lipoyl-binding protein [Rhodospirillaceae bacterium]